jgi:hypothetical protein
VYYRVQNSPTMFPILSEVNPVHNRPCYFLALHLPMYHYVFQMAVFLQLFISVLFRACHMARMGLHLITLIGLIFEKEYNHEALHYEIFFRVLLLISSSVQIAFVLRQLFSNILGVYFFHNLRGQVSHPYKMTSKITGAV